MKKRDAAMAVLALMAGVITAGCERQTQAPVWDASENSIYVTKDMDVESAMRYTSEKSNELYTQEGLFEFAKAAVSEFNKTQGAEGASENTSGSEKLPAALKSCKLEGQTGTLVFDYGAPEYFVKFSKEYEDNTHTVTGLSVATVSDMALSEEFADSHFLTASGKEAKLSDVQKKTDAVVIAVKGSASVYTEGRVSYVTEGCVVKNSYAVAAPEGMSYIVFNK